MSNIIVQITLFISVIVIGVMGLVVTYFNAKRYKMICENYEKINKTIYPAAISFRYYNFSFSYISFPIEKLTYVYFPLLFSKRSSLNKKDIHKWYDFINSQDRKIKSWFYLEMAIFLICTAMFVVLIVGHYLK